MNKSRFSWVVGSQADPKKEKKYNQWYDQHITTFFNFNGLKRVSRSRICRPLGDQGNKSPQYVTIYEFDSKNDLDAFMKSQAFASAAKEYDENWPGLGDMLFSGWYEPFKVWEKQISNANEGKTAKNRFLEVVGSGPKPGKEAEYKQWYIEHITMLFPYEGLKKVSLSRLIQPMGDNGKKSPMYVTVYEFDTRENMNAFYRPAIMSEADKHFEAKGKSAVDIYWAACYEPAKTLER